MEKLNNDHINDEMEKVLAEYAGGGNADAEA